MHHHLAEGHQRQAGVVGDPGQLVEAGWVSPVIVRCRAKKTLAGEGAQHVPQVADRCPGRVLHRVGRQRDQHHALTPIQQILARQMTFAFCGSPLAEGQEPGQPRPGRDVGG